MEKKEQPSDFRIEHDSFGPINVRKDCYWAAQTQRSIQNFAIGTVEDRMPLAITKALALIKKSAAIVNLNYGLKQNLSDAIVQAADDVIHTPKLDDQFTLVIFQTGSGTQSNMNTNEVISNRSVELMGGKLGDKPLVHPNDHVNKGQSSNDTFPTAMHIAITLELHKFLLPVLDNLEANLAKKVIEFADIIKIGRTHTQDATPLTLGQNFSAFLTQIKNSITHIKDNIPFITQLAQGGTAVGTGLNTKRGYDKAIANEISRQTGIQFKSSENKFESLACHDALVNLSGSLNGLATSLFKIAQDVKLLAAELGEFVIEDVTPCDEMLMACIQAIGNHTTVSVGSN